MRVLAQCLRVALRRVCTGAARPRGPAQQSPIDDGRNRFTMQPVRVERAMQGRPLRVKRALSRDRGCAEAHDARKLTLCCTHHITHQMASREESAEVRNGLVKPWS